MKYEEVEVAASDALADGEMKAVAVGETSVLLARVSGRYYAVGAECTHYHAPLAEGVLDGRAAQVGPRVGRHGLAPVGIVRGGMGHRGASLSRASACARSHAAAAS